MFTGELMQCAQCQCQQRSHPHIESGWFKVASRGELAAHLCPKCAGSVAPKCQQCSRFYHERYRECPWCRLQVRAKGFGKGGDRP